MQKILNAYKKKLLYIFCNFSVGKWKNYKKFCIIFSNTFIQKSFFFIDIQRLVYVVIRRLNEFN